MHLPNTNTYTSIPSLSLESDGLSPQLSVCKYTCATQYPLEMKNYIHIFVCDMVDNMLNLFFCRCFDIIKMGIVSKSSKWHGMRLYFGFALAIGIEFGFEFEFEILFVCAVIHLVLC